MANKKLRKGIIITGCMMALLCTACRSKKAKNSNNKNSTETVAQDTANADKGSVNTDNDTSNTENDTSSTENTDENSNVYASFLQEQGSDKYYALVNIGLEYPVLLVTDQVYNEPDGTNTDAICAKVYYMIDQKVTLLNTISSDGTAYPIASDEHGLYVGGNHFGTYYTVDPDTKKLVVKESVKVEYDKKGNATYDHEIGDEKEEDGEDGFEQFFERMGNYINFKANDGK